MSNRYSHTTTANGHKYDAYLYEWIGEKHCEEVVYEDGTQVHWAEFPSRNLSGGDRGEYVKVMCESIRDKRKRERAGVTPEGNKDGGNDPDTIRREGLEP